MAATLHCFFYSVNQRVRPTGTTDTRTPNEHSRIPHLLHKGSQMLVGVRCSDRIVLCGRRSRTTESQNPSPLLIICRYLLPSKEKSYSSAAMKWAALQCVIGKFVQILQCGRGSCLYAVYAARRAGFTRELPNFELSAHSGDRRRAKETNTHMHWLKLLHTKLHLHIHPDRHTQLCIHINDKRI